MLEALTVALGDASPLVVNAALDAIHPVVEALYRCINLASPRLKTPNLRLTAAGSTALRCTPSGL